MTPKGDGSSKAADETYSEEETARRRDEAVLRALRTPPQPRKGKGDDQPAKPHKDSQKGSQRDRRSPRRTQER